MKKLWGSTAMIVATILWGAAFSAQSRGMEFVDPMLFTALRSLVGFLALIPLIVVLDLIRTRRVSVLGSGETREQKLKLFKGGIWCGVVISVASVCQQYGLKYTSAGKTGFLTALYIIFVPVLGLFFKRKASFFMYLAVVIGLAGAYLLCGGISNIGIGEWFVIICALIFSVHIMIIDHFASGCDCVRLSAIQFAVATVLTAAASLLFRDKWIWENIAASMPFWVFCGVGSSAIAFTLQMVAQKYLHPVAATLLMSLESVFAVLGGWLFLNEYLTPREKSGCVIIFLSVLLAQLPSRRSGSSR